MSLVLCWTRPKSRSMSPIHWQSRRISREDESQLFSSPLIRVSTENNPQEVRFNGGSLMDLIDDGSCAGTHSTQKRASGGQHWHAAPWEEDVVGLPSKNKEIFWILGSIRIILFGAAETGFETRSDSSDFLFFDEDEPEIFSITKKGTGTSAFAFDSTISVCCFGSKIFCSITRFSGRRMLWQVKLRLSLLPRNNDLKFDERCSKKISSNKKLTSFFVGWTLTSTFCVGNLQKKKMKPGNKARKNNVNLLDR